MQADPLSREKNLILPSMPPVWIFLHINRMLQCQYYPYYQYYHYWAVNFTLGLLVTKGLLVSVITIQYFSFTKQSSLF